jgi:secreted trypsin-like serine protease
VTACAPRSQTEDKVDTSDTAIVGGQEVAAGSALTKSVALMMNRMTTEICTVSLLNNQFAVTAAHCVSNVDDRDLFLFFDTKLQASSPRRRVIDHKTSPYYNSLNTRKVNTGDIAVIRFFGGLPAGYTPATLLPNEYLLRNGTNVVVAGYGVTDGQTRVGTGTLRTATASISNAHYSASEVTLDQTRGSGACYGDSGGPAYLLTGGKYVLWGVISRSPGEDNCLKTAVITNALVYTGWIKETIQKLLSLPVLIPNPEENPLAK